MMSEEVPPAVKAMIEFAERFGEAISAWLERMAPAFESFLEVCNRPEVLAAIERAHAEFVWHPCHCLCQRLHPDVNVCDNEAVTTRRFTTDLTGPVDVPLCAPCATAQGVAELVR